MFVDCMLSGGERCSGQWGQPMDHNATLCLSGWQLSGELKNNSDVTAD